MRILLINNFFRDVGGVERVFFIERDLLHTHGHEVIDFSTEHPANYPSSYSKFFVSGVDFYAPGHLLKKAARFFYSFEVARKLNALIDETKPEVAHIQGIFDALGPTVVSVLRRRKIPIVFTTHAYKLVCPNGRLFAHGHVDDLCKKNILNDVFGATVQNSFVKSLWAALALASNRARGIFSAFDRIISPSMFLIHQHTEFGWPAEKFLHVPNPIDITKFSVQPSEDSYMLFVGRLVEEKGVEMLVEAARELPNIPLKIIGDGPLMQKLLERVREIGAINISFEGAQSPENVRAYFKNAAAVIVSSICYENDPYSVLEAQASGKVVIAAYSGGIPEQIREGETGFLFERGNVVGLAAAMRHIWGLKPQERAKIGLQARAFVDTVRDPELYYEVLTGILGCLLDKIGN
ncbi:MAG: glycosyltransferase [Candidatus Magasanikbacteria bacterium]|nr:glycosyltransferase [Candidatus Magasanikbacteria bacterium]